MFCRLTGIDIRSDAEAAATVRAILAEVPSIICGDFSRLSASTLSEVIDDLENNLQFLESHAISPFVPYFSKQPFLITKGREAISRLSLQCRDQIIRRQPFGILIAGNPGCGKSFAAMRILKALYDSVHGELQPQEIIVLNEGDQFQSEFRTSHKAVVFDDLGATRVNIVNQDPFRKIIDFINNIPRTALNPNVELKGNVWIQPEIVVATTNMIIPFEHQQARNTDSMLSPEAINRRFPLMIAQKSYDQFYLATGHQPIKHEGHFVGKCYSFRELVSYAKGLYRKHYEDQQQFVDTVHKTLYPESLNSSIVFSAVTSLQAFIRYMVAHKAFRGDLDISLLLATCRSFAQLPLQKLKVAAQRQISSNLRNQGYDSVYVLETLDQLQKFSVAGSTVSSICGTHDRLRNLLDVLSVTVPITTNYAIKSVVPRSWHFVYDTLTVALPYMVGNIFNKKFQDSIGGTSTPEEVEKPDSLFSYLYSYLPSFPSWKLKWLSVDSFYSTLVLLRLRTELKPESRTRNGLELTPKGKSSSIKVSAELNNRFEPEVYLPGSHIYTIFREYKEGQLTLPALLAGFGSMRSGDFQVVYSINFIHEQFVSGIFMLAYTPKSGTLYVLRTINKALTCKLNTMHWLLQCIYSTSRVNIVFVAASVNTVNVAPMYPKNLKGDWKGEIEDLFKNRFVAKSFLKLKHGRKTVLKCQPCAAKFGRYNCPTDSLVSVPNKISPPPLPRGFQGAWISRERYRNRSGFAAYACRKCKKEWLSAHGSRQYPQICKYCRKAQHADFFLCGTFNGEDSFVQMNPHPSKFCLACQAGDLEHLENVRNLP